MKHLIPILGLLAALSGVATAQESPITQAALDDALARYAGEPSVHEVLDAALRGTADPARARDALRRARLSGLLPELRVRVRRGQAIDLSALTTNDGDRTNVSTDDNLVVEGTVVFRLDRLLYAPAEASALRELRVLELERRELIRVVCALYFERRRLQLERDLLGPDLLRTVRIAEIEAYLDALSDGFLRRRLRRRAAPST